MEKCRGWTWMSHYSGYFPFFSIVLFSISFGLFGENALLHWFENIGLYGGMLEFLSEQELRILLFVFCSITCFMLLAALKLVAETFHEFAVLLFVRTEEDAIKVRVNRSGLTILLIGGFVSVLFTKSIFAIGLIFITTKVVYFFYYLYQMSSVLTPLSLIGFITFQITSWSSSIVFISYAFLKLYNSILASLPI
jgi:hypothetical protein